MNIKYVNHLNEELDLSGVPYLLQNCDAFDYAWDGTMTAKGLTQSKIDSFKRTSKRFQAELLIKSDNFSEAIDFFFRVTEKDVIAKSPGRLVLETGEYLSCYIVETKHSGFHVKNKWNMRQLTILSAHPFWIKELNYSFFPVVEIQNQEHLDYNYDYAYDYAANSTAGVFNVEHYTDCDFEMILYGPCENPRVVIGNNVYGVYDSLSNQEYVIIDSRKHTVVKHCNNGTVTNIYDLRMKEKSVFDKITCGKNHVIRNSNFGFDVKLYLERSEPKW